MALNEDVLVIPGLIATTTGAAQSVAIGKRSLQGATIQVLGTFVATFTLQVSTNGVDFVNAVGFTGGALAAFTTISIALVGGEATHVRLNYTVNTSGTVVARFCFAHLQALADRGFAG